VILILADPTDPWGIALSRRLALRGEPYVIRNPGEMQNLRVSDQEGDWAQSLTGVYRGMSRPFSEEVPASRPLFPHEAGSDWLAELNSLACPVVNRLSPEGSVFCRTGSPAWEAVVLAHGFQLPRFHAAFNREEALSYLDRWDGAVYVKPAGVVHGGLVLPAEAARDYTGDLAPDRPIFLAQVSPGQLVSLFVVGEGVAATVVRRGMRSETPMPFARLGPALLQRCSDLVLALGLVHAECLLSLSADGQITCLDVLASPNFWTCPREAQQQVVGRLAGYLAGGERSTCVTPVAKEPEEFRSVDCVAIGVPEDH
jgi:hypothetical protein